MGYIKIEQLLPWESSDRESIRLGNPRPENLWLGQVFYDTARFPHLNSLWKLTKICVRQSRSISDARLCQFVFFGGGLFSSNLKHEVGICLNFESATCRLFVVFSFVACCWKLTYGVEKSKKYHWRSLGGSLCKKDGSGCQKWPLRIAFGPEIITSQIVAVWEMEIVIHWCNTHRHMCTVLLELVN